MDIALKQDEHIRETYRQSRFVLIHPITMSIFTVIIPWYFVLRYGGYGGIITTVLWFWTFIVAIHLLYEVYLWYKNTYVVTNLRLIHYDQKSLFKKTVVETPHERVLNVSYKTEGIISSFVGYGNVEIQVVGLMEPMIMKNVNTPMEIKDYLWDMHARATKNKSDHAFSTDDIEHLQERAGYTKKDQRII